MKKELQVHAAELVANARRNIEEIDAVDALNLLGDPRTLFVDLRDVRERQKLGYIPGSFHCPRGMAEFWVDPESPYYKDVFGQDLKFIFYCGSGWRSSLTLETLQKMGFENAAHVTDGFTSWVKAGGAVEKAKSTAAQGS